MGNAFADFWFRVYQLDGAIIRYKYLTEYILIAKPNGALAGKENIYFYTGDFYLQDVLNFTNEQDRSFLDCKHKHMMKSGAPPDKVLHLQLSIEFIGFTSRIDF